jgi:hypothetical protein
MRSVLAMLPLIPQLVVLSHASAQKGEPFTATVSMTRKVLAVGECSAVSLALKEASTQEWPRGPNGSLVTMADFDLTVSAPAARAAVGQYDGPNSFTVCACPKAPVGTVATVTATYPSKWIAPKVRVPGVSFSTTMSAPIAAGASSGNPPGCDAPNASTGGPWLVTVQPSVSVLAIGSCSAVSLTIRDSTGKTTPRNPAGTLVSIADFDMSATTANGADVVGKQYTPSSFSACACQSGTVGEAATITAKYPGSQLDPKARVPRAEMQVTAPLTLAKAVGAANPPGCGAKKREQQIAGAPMTIVAPVAARSAVIGVPIVTDARAGVAITEPAIARHDVPPASAPIVVSAPMARDTSPLAVAPPIAPGTTTGGAQSLFAAAAPTGVAVSASPRIARLTWNAVPNAQRYAVWRANGTVLSVERTPPAYTATHFADTVPDPHETYRYSVTAYLANGITGAAPVVEFTSPPMVNPAGFTAQVSGVLGFGVVTFQWQAVPGAARYRLDGPGLPATGYFVLGTSLAHPHMPGGPSTWRLQTMYPGNFGDSAGASIASAMVHVLPSRSIKWLTKNNGAGLPYQVQTPEHQVYNDDVGGSPIGTWSGDLMPVYDATYASWLGQPFTWSGGRFVVTTDPNAPPCAGSAADPYGCVWPGLKLWLTLPSAKLWDDSGQAVSEAVYGNPGDLGVGRRAFCFQMDSIGYRGLDTPSPAGPYTVCYATAHGIPPGQAGFNDPQTITHPGEGVGGDFILSMVIVKDGSGTVFLVLGKSGKYTLLPTVKLDTEGPKLVPFVCIACHGGKYNATTRKVDGSSFLPLDPNLLSFASPADQAAQEEKIRNINFMIHRAQPGSAIASYLNGLYHGAIGTAGTTATTDYVPASWAPQAGFYRQVVRANCTMCHLAAPDTWNFASWQNFQDNANLIYADVCLQHTMPHAEVPFKNFWLKDTGILYLPGLLAATLGKPSC